LQLQYYGLYEKTITVTYNAAGGSPTPAQQTGTQYFNASNMATPLNPTFTMPAEPSRERYTFGGWKEGGNTYAAWDNVSLGQDTTITAHWNEIRVDGISLSQYNLIVNEGGVSALDAFVSPANATFPEYTWSSSDESVVTIDRAGNVTAVNGGMATITATTEEGGFFASCAVTVMLVTDPVTSISISQSSALLTIGDSLPLSAQVAPANATIRDVEWCSSNHAVATVDQNGFVQSTGVGTAVISARTVQGGLQAICDVTVQPIRVTGVALGFSENALFVGQTLQWSATVSPENATDKTVHWLSSDNAVATVDQNGLVTAVGVGMAEIAAITEDGGLREASSVTVTIPVASIALSPDHAVMYEESQRDFEATALDIEATVLPLDATDRSLSWASSAPAIVSVNQNGYVTTNWVGADTSAVISVTANDGSGATAQAEVVVLQAAAAPGGGGATGAAPSSGGPTVVTRYAIDMLISALLSFDLLFSTMAISFLGVPMHPFLDIAIDVANVGYPLEIKASKTDEEKYAYAKAMYVRGQIYERKTGIPARVFAVISCNECGYGTSPIAINQNNIFGWKAASGSNATFSSIQACINQFNLRVGSGSDYAWLHGHDAEYWIKNIGAVYYDDAATYERHLREVINYLKW
jgi:uncharacterized repeat protein (TIGR02543 family)